MPTGYTCDVQSGKITEFRDFALLCARAMGFLIMMRDEPLGAPLPDVITADTASLDKSIIEATQELSRLRRLTPKEIDDETNAAHQRELKIWEEREARRLTEKARYEAMLEKVHAWDCPIELEGMKSFMTNQLEESIKFDCSPFEKPVKRDPLLRHAQMLKHAEWCVEYRTEDRKKDIESASKRNKYLQLLKKSLEK